MRLEALHTRIHDAAMEVAEIQVKSLLGVLNFGKYSHPNEFG